MYSCVKIVTPIGTGVHTETISGIIDAHTGLPFVARTVFLFGGNTAGVNLLTYWGMSSSNSAGDSGFHWDNGISHDNTMGAQGGGCCHDGNLKICSGADGYGWPFMDTWPDIFFGGYIGGYGYINNVQSGTFDITWARRDRAGDSKIMLCLAGDEYDIHFLSGAANGVVGPPLNILPGKPQGIIQMPAAVSTPGGGAAATGAGGTSYSYGWDTRDGNRGAAFNSSGSQAGNSCAYWLDRMSSSGAYVSAWGDTTYTIAGATGGGGMQVIWCGANLVVKAGSFSIPASDGGHSFNMGLDAKAVIFQTVGTSVAGTVDSTRASGSIGFCDPALSQCSYWTGDTTVGNGIPLTGSRYISDSHVTRVATSTGSSTVFKNIGTVELLHPNGNIGLNFTDTDGTAPKVIWLAIGVELSEDVNMGKGIYKLVPDKRQDTIWFDATAESKYLAKKPMPSASSFYAGDE